MRYHLITGIDTMIRKHPECGVTITGDFNQLNDNFLKVHYILFQVVNVVTRGQATLDKIWTNMNGFYSTPVSISELRTSNHCMVLWKPVGSCTGRASARGPGQPAAHGPGGPGFYDILRAGPGAGLKFAGPGRARAGK